MANLNRKMLLTLDDETYLALVEFGEASEKAAATVVREILAASVPQIRQTTKMLNQIKKGVLSEAIQTGFQVSRDTQMKLSEAQSDLAQGAIAVAQGKGKEWAEKKDLEEAKKPVPAKRGRRARA